MARSDFDDAARCAWKSAEGLVIFPSVGYKIEIVPHPGGRNSQKSDLFTQEGT